MLPVAVTAANALVPIIFPTIRESTVLYICWNSWPMKTGMAKRTIRFHTVPSVIK